MILKKNDRKEFFMHFNNTINHLKLWCREKAHIYEMVYEKHKDITYVGISEAYELEFKLSTLIDRSFENTDDLKKTILELVDVKYETVDYGIRNELAQYIIEKVKKEFCEYVEEITEKNDTLSFADIPYKRIILGEEAQILLERFKTVWKYDNSDYWYPLNGDEPEEITGKFFIMYDYLKPYKERLEKIIGLPETHIYRCDEADLLFEYCTETVELSETGRSEVFYTDKDFTWAIYFSHESTVAFAGSIVPAVKALLMLE